MTSTFGENYMSQTAISLVDKKMIVTTFLRQCNNYSDEMLKKYQAQLYVEGVKESAVQKIHDWSVYREFNKYAIQELGGHELDDWFK
jgi:hypothetical protein